MDHHLMVFYLMTSYERRYPQEFPVDKTYELLELTPFPIHNKSLIMELKST